MNWNNDRRVWAPYQGGRKNQDRGGRRNYQQRNKNNVKFAKFTDQHNSSNFHEKQWQNNNQNNNCPPHRQSHPDAEAPDGLIRQQRPEAEEAGQLNKAAAKLNEDTTPTNDAIKEEQWEKTKQQPAKMTIDKHSSNSAKAKSSSSSAWSSSSESDDFVDEEAKQKAADAAALTSMKKHAQETAKTPKSANLKAGKSADVICLGKVSNKVVVEDDDDDDDDDDENSSRASQKCMLCDNIGHTSFQCQMICRNCSAPYHNLKNCPRPANLHVMLQSFLEFCLEQLNNYNPMQQFVMPLQTAFASPSLDQSTKLITATVAAKRLKLKRQHSKARERKLSSVNSKKLKRKSKIESDDDESSGEKDENRDDEQETSTETESSDSSAKKTVKTKKTKRKIAKPSTGLRAKITGIPPTFPPLAGIHLPFTGLPGLHTSQTSAGTAGFNPLLFGQMLQSYFPLK